MGQLSRWCGHNPRLDHYLSTLDDAAFEHIFDMGADDGTSQETPLTFFPISPDQKVDMMTFKFVWTRFTFSLAKVNRVLIPQYILQR